MPTFDPVNELPTAVIRVRMSAHACALRGESR